MFKTALSAWPLFAALAFPQLCAAQFAASPQPITCRTGDTQCLASLISNHPVRQPAHWQALRSRPLDERVLPGTPALVNFLELDVLYNRIPSRPKAAAADDEMLDELKRAVRELPANIRSMMDKRLVGVFLVSGFGGTGFTDAVRWGGTDSAGFIVLDPDALRKRAANEWASWKENSPFRDDGDWRIEAIIAAPGDNQRQRAVQYILLHEIAHVLATRDVAHPSWVPPIEAAKPGRYPFFDLSWERNVAQQRDVTRFGKSWPGLNKVRYYFGAQLGGEDMLTAYKWLAKTNFPSLYAATSAGDDFAESFVTYVHTVLQKRPWEIRILHGGTLRYRLGSCWEEERCAEKRKVLEKLLADFEQEALPAAKPMASAGQ